VADLLVLWRIPDASAERALVAYREAATEGIPYVASGAFAADVATARSCWALVSVSWSGAALVALSRPVTGFETRHAVPRRLGPASTLLNLPASSWPSQARPRGRSDLALALAPTLR